MTPAPPNQSRWAKFLTKPSMTLAGRYAFAVVMMALAFEVRDVITMGMRLVQMLTAAPVEAGPGTEFRVTVSLNGAIAGGTYPG